MRLSTEKNMVFLSIITREILLYENQLSKGICLAIGLQVNNDIFPELETMNIVITTTPVDRNNKT